MKFLAKSNQIRAVTVRELTRNVAEIFEYVEGGEPVLIIRRGRPIATIQPLEQFVVRRAIENRRNAEAEPKPVLQPPPDLTDTEWAVLEAIAKREHPDDLMTQVRLEVRGLAKKTRYGWWEPTLKGIEALDARSEASDGGVVS
ncbi:MAG TPA: type II toxin-antitoxin system prevent-host-death family antitoxin [Actinomycetota bacterium]|nr:type II toxin-antitoxin system prevent-host-death family antitoxin [Actinomycetota bacterium]